MKNSTARVVDPDSLVLAIETRMTLADWEKVSIALKEHPKTGSYAVAQFVYEINDLIRQARKQFHPDPMPEGEPS